MAKKLDKNKNFGEIFGGGRKRYLQDGRYFDVHGDEIAQAAEGSVAVPAEEMPKKGGKGKAAAAENEQASLLDDQLAAQAAVVEE